MTLRHQIVLALVAGVLLTAAGKSFVDEASFGGVADDAWIMRADSGSVEPVMVLKPGVSLTCSGEGKTLSFTAEPGKPLEVSCVGPNHFHPEHFSSDFKQ